MSKFVILLGVVVIGRVIPKTRTHTEGEYWSSWQEFLSMEEVKGRTLGYKSKQEHDERFEIFKDSMETIKAHNAENHPWRMAINQFADMTASEFKEHVSCTMEKKTGNAEVFTAPDDWTAPTSIDWVEEGQVTPVKNQGGCGSCWAFSTTGAIESRSSIAGKGLTSLSEQNLVDCSTANSGCNGGLMDYAFEYVMTNGGLCSESSYPYTAVDGTCNGYSCTKYDPITSYSDVAVSTAALEAAVAEGPVAIAIEADQSSFQYYGGGVLTAACGTSLDHGVLVVGYGTDTYGGDYWKVKNSWGANWGESGYIRLCRNCGANGGDGECGILMSASYPIV